MCLEDVSDFLCTVINSASVCYRLSVAKSLNQSLMKGRQSREEGLHVSIVSYIVSIAEGVSLAKLSLEVLKQYGLCISYAHSDLCGICTSQPLLVWSGRGCRWAYAELTLLQLVVSTEILHHRVCACKDCSRICLINRVM